MNAGGVGGVPGPVGCPPPTAEPNEGGPAVGNGLPVGGGGVGAAPAAPPPVSPLFCAYQAGAA
ncbi:hypothetical protein [Streptomyces sp. 8N706]|uniref:hypothetical protein n=1 Tax=Streptomyces sp. 8N706 TaxID=3457416 RepID=UPI003FCF4862